MSIAVELATIPVVAYFVVSLQISDISNHREDRYLPTKVVILGEDSGGRGRLTPTKVVVITEDDRIDLRKGDRP